MVASVHTGMKYIIPGEPITRQIGIWDTRYGVKASVHTGINIVYLEEL